MRKASYLYRLLNITLALLLILSQIQPVFVMAEEGVSETITLEEASSNEMITVNGSVASEESTDAVNQPESEASTNLENQVESEESTKTEDKVESEENADVKNQTESVDNSKVEDQKNSAETLDIDVKSNGKLDVQIGNPSLSFRGENEPMAFAYWGAYNDVRTVTVKADFTGYTSDKTVRIAFDKAVVLHTDPNKLVDGRQILSVDTSNYTDYEIETSNAGTLTFKEGFIELGVADTINSVSFNILVSIDERLVDTIKDQIITFSDEAMVVTSLVGGNEVDKKILDRITVNAEIKAAVNTRNKSSLFTDNDIVYNINVSPAGFNTNVAEVDRFYRMIEVRTSIPYTLSGNQKTYADVSNFEALIPGTDTEIPGKFTVDPTTQEIIFTCEDVYLSAIQINMTLRFDSSKFTDGETVYFEDAGLKIKGALTQDFELPMEKLPKTESTGTIVTATKERVEIDTLELPIYKDDNDFYHMGGSFSITNLGAKSGEKIIRFDFPYGSNALVGAGTFRIPLPSHMTKFDVKLEFWDKSDNTVYKHTHSIDRKVTADTNNGTGYALNLDSFKGYAGLADKDVYYKSIEYVVDYFPTGYNSGGPNRQVGATGVYTAKYFADREGTTATETAATLTITDPTNPLQPLSQTIIPVLEDEGIVTAALDTKTEFRDMQDQVIKGSITSGESFYLYTNPIMSNHLYYNASFLKNPVFRVKVPNGIDIDFDKTIFSFNDDFSTSLDFEVNDSNPGTSRDGARIYTFTFKDKDLTLGGIKSDFTINNNPIYVKVYMSSLKSIKTLALNSQDIIFLDSESMTLNTGGSWHPHRLRDTNDVNENNNIYDFVFTTNSSSILTFTEATWIDSNFTVGINNNDISSTNVVLKNYEDTFELKVGVENDVSWIVDQNSFKYYFPIPKKGAKLANQFKPGVQEIDLSFKEAVVSSPLKVLYSTDESAFMDPDGASYSDTPPANLTDITMVKVVSEQDLVTGDIVEMKVVYQYGNDSENFIYDASNQSLFSPYGSISMRSSSGGTGLISGYDVFPQVHVTLKPLISENPKDIVVNWHEDGEMSFKTEEPNRIQSIQWQIKTPGSSDWANIAGATAQTLTLLKNQLDQNGELYRVVVTSKDGTVLYSSPARLIVLGFSVTIPKEITLDSVTGSSDYEVSLKAQVPEGQVLSVKPDQSFNMSDAFGKSDITATVTQDEIEWETSELDPHSVITKTGNIQVSNLTAGEWSGNFNFTIGFETK